MSVPLDLRARLYQRLSLEWLPRCRPLQALVPLNGGGVPTGDGTLEVVGDWEATTTEPEAVLLGQRLNPGWHIIEQATQRSAASAASTFTFETAAGAVSVVLPLRVTRVTKRLVYVPFGVRHVRFSPINTRGRFRISHFRLVWITPWFARDRLLRRLANMHPVYRDRPRGEIARRLGRRAAEEGRAWRDVALEAYDATFASVCSRRNYRQWVQQIEGARRAERREACRGLEALASPPGFAVLVPAGPDAQAALHATLESLQAQSWPHWQAAVFGPGGDEQEAARGHGVGRDGRVVFVQTAAASSLARQRAALQAVAGDRVLVLAPGDRLAPDALGILAGAAAERPEAALIYADEDRLDPEGLRHDPHLKPRWNPDLLLSTPYVGRPALWRREALEAIDRALDGTDTDGDALDHARILGLLAADGAAVAHVPEVLVHRGPAADDRPWAPADTVRAALTGQGRAAQVTAGRLPGTVRVRWPLPDPAPTVSLVMPTRDRVDVLRPCVDAILRRTEYPDYELLILDNQSRCPETLGYLDAVARRDPRVRVLRWDHPFNYSAINNYGVAHARGALVALVNNDVEPLDGGWLEELVRHALRPDIGCVGAKLHYPDGTVQHGGVILGLGGVAGHAHRYFPREDPGFMGRLQVVQNLSAVTGACLVVRRALYEQVGGLNARDLPVAYNDVDFCLRVREAGYRNLWTPYAELVHHESASRGTDDTPAKRRRAERELAWMRRRWGPLLDDDPAYNPNLTRVHEDFSLG